jgi:hypothetical protein
MLAVELAVELETAEAWLLLTFPIDIMTLIATAGIRGIGRDSKNLRFWRRARLRQAAGSVMPERRWQAASSASLMKTRAMVGSFMRRAQ